jgi:membrane-bound lytic murein transglycosylase D
MKTKTLTRIVALLFTALPLFYLGCASSNRLHAQNQKTAGDKTYSVDAINNVMPALKDSTISADSFVSKYSTEIPVTPDKSDIDFLIQSAKEYCQADSFPIAHSLLKKALLEIKEKADIDSSPAESEASYDEIASIYTELMPSEYGDSIPDEISMLVFQKQLSQSLDTMKISPNNSIIMKRLTCQKGITYNFPILWNDRVYKSLNFFAGGRKGPLDKWLARSAYYLPFMQRMFADSGLPTDLAYLPLIESGFNPLAYSRARASGIWQFIASTGTLYGLRKNYWLDERRDPVKSTGAAISYLKKLFNQFEDWQLALAAYNCGENSVSNACVRSSSTNYWQLHLPRETKNYVPEFISALIVAKNPQCFGYSPGIADTFDFDSLILDQSLNMHAIADSLGIASKELQIMNPHIMHWCTPPGVNNVHLYLPHGTKERLAASYALDPDAYKVTWYNYEVKSGQKLGSIARQFKVPLDALKSMNSLNVTSRLSVGQNIFIPIPLHMSTAEAALIAEDMLHTQPQRALPSADKSGAIKYRVRHGDTVWELARLFHTSAGNICTWNNINRNQGLMAGQILVLYTKSTRQKSTASFKASAGNDAPAAQAPKRVIGGQNYEVQKGETLYAIAKKLGVSVSSLAALNGLDVDKPVIYAGQKIVCFAEARRVQQPSAPLADASQPDTVLYRVCKGDNLSSLAQSFAVTVNELVLANNLSAFAPLRVGAVLRIPMGKRQS